jgi:hypothetical protein
MWLHRPTDLDFCSLQSPVSEVSMDIWG